MLGIGELAMPPRPWHVLGLVLLPVMLGTESCGLRDKTPAKSAAEVVIRVGDKGYTQSDLESFFESRLNEFRNSAASDDVMSALLDSFIEEKLLLSKAERLKVEANPQVLASMRKKLSQSADGNASGAGHNKDIAQSMTDSLKIQQYLHDYLFKNLSATKEECEAYYKEHLDDFVSNDVVLVSEILVDSAEQAQKIQAALKAKRNKNFAELARLYSKAPTASDGGALGSFQRGELPENFEKVIFPLAPGTVSKPISTQYGYHTFKVDEKILAHQQRFYEVESQIHEKLLQERQRVALDKELESLTNQMPVKVDRDRLSFKYTGSRLAAHGGKPK
jgi:peptidyl-prolyl cis-trans isomerase C